MSQMATIYRPPHRELIDLMLKIEDTPLTVENIRSISLLMRRLIALCSAERDSALVNFCFGLLTVNFAPLWNDVYGVFKSISQRSGNKIWDMAFSRLVDHHGSATGPAEISSRDLLTDPLSVDSIWNESVLDSKARLGRFYETVLSPLRFC